jgi:hypothetical protein
MASNRKFDETISTWLEDTAPTGLPQRVLAATFERTRSSRQQLGWRGVLGRLQMPRFIPALGGAAVVVMAAVLALNFMSVSGPGGTTTTSPSAARPATPPAEAQVTELLNSFLAARVAGEGAEEYLSISGDSVSHCCNPPPLLYATTSGAPYDRAEFEPVLGIEWPYGYTAFKVRLFAGDTVVEQLFFWAADNHLELVQRVRFWNRDRANHRGRPARGHALQLLRRRSDPARRPSVGLSRLRETFPPDPGGSRRAADDRRRAARRLG